MKKKVKGSSWRYNAGIARPWLNEEDEAHESSESTGEEQEGEFVEDSASTVNAGEMERLSERVHSMGDAGGRESHTAPSEPAHEAAPAPSSGYVPNIPVAKPYVPPIYAAPAHSEAAAEAAPRQSFTPPPAPAPAPAPAPPAPSVKPAPAQEFNIPPVERPNIPARPSFTPNIPPIPPAPTTQRIAERLAQQRMEGYWQVPPAPEKPAAQPTTPVIEQQHVAEVFEPAASPVHAAPPEPVIFVETSVPYEPPSPRVVEPPFIPSNIEHAVVETSQPPVPPAPAPAAPASAVPVSSEVETPKFTPPSTFVSRPFHPESYFTPAESRAPEPVSSTVEPEEKETVVQAFEAEISEVVIAEPAPAVAQPTEVESPMTHKPEGVSTPRYGAPAAFAEESVFQPAQPRESAPTPVESQFQPKQPESAPAHSVSTHDEQLLKRLAAQQAVQAAEAKAAQEIAQKVAAQSQPKKEKPQPPAVSNLPARITSGERPTGLTRTVNAIRAALPVIQRLLPLLEGNISKTVSNLLAPQHHEPATPPPPPMDLVPINRGLAEIQKQHRELREQLVTQNVSLQRVEDQLSHVATATDRNTREQQELVEEIQMLSKRQSRFSTFVLILLLVSIAANVLLFLLVKHIIQ